jgi:hypothetical protein
MWWLLIACGTSPAPQPDAPSAKPVGWAQLARDVAYVTSLAESPALNSQVFNRCGADRACVLAARDELEHQGLRFVEVSGRPHVQTIALNDQGGVAVLLDSEVRITHERADQFDMQSVPGTESGPQVPYLPADALRHPPLLAVQIVDATAISLSGPDGRPMVYRQRGAAPPAAPPTSESSP